MPDLDDELIARALQWCAEAGRQATADQVRAALAPLSWDQLLAARALLADPPPARPLGPWALADLARGADPGTAAGRERDGQYRAEPDEEPQSEAAAPATPPPEALGDAVPAPSRRRGAPRARRAAGPVIHRARDRVEPAAPAPAPLPPFEELLESEGRAVLERLLRVHGARRARLVGALSAGWRRRDAAPVGDADLQLLLDAHGMARSFERRERDELLHTLRGAGGVLGRAAEQVGATVEEFTASLDRLRATADAEAIRSLHRDELRRRRTLSERVRLVVEDRERLADLAILDELDDDLRRRLPEHLRALRAAGAGPLLAALSRSLSIPPRDAGGLLQRLGIAFDAPPPAAEASPGRARPAPSPARGGRPPPRGDRTPARRDDRSPRRGDRAPARRGERPPSRGGDAPGRTPTRRPTPLGGARPPARRAEPRPGKPSRPDRAPAARQGPGSGRPSRGGRDRPASPGRRRPR